MTVSSTFSLLETPSLDPIIEIMSAFAKDTHPDKIDVSAGVYKTDEGDPNYVFPCVKAAKQKLAAHDPGHCYTLMSGIPAFVSSAKKIIFGADHDDVISVQTISGSGALHLAFQFLLQTGFQNFYVGAPAWSNYRSMIEHVGGIYHEYKYYDPVANVADFEAALEALKIAPAQSVFVLQAVCHNPTGCDYSKEQWVQILDVIQERNIFPLFDIAYQGFASGNVDDDAWVIREAYKRGIEFVTCQSFSKNMGLYSERAGCTHVRVTDKEVTQSVSSLLVATIRSEFSFAPAFGARVASIVQQDDELNRIWAEDVLAVTQRLVVVRQQVLDKLTKLQTPGNWKPIVSQNGLFWYSGLTPLQVQKLMDEHHIYGTPNGRVNVAGLNSSNIDAYCEAIDTIVRKYPSEA